MQIPCIQGYIPTLTAIIARVGLVGKLGERVTDFGQGLDGGG